MIMALSLIQMAIESITLPDRIDSRRASKQAGVNRKHTLLVGRNQFRAINGGENISNCFCDMGSGAYFRWRRRCLISLSLPLPLESYGSLSNLIIADGAAAVADDGSSVYLYFPT